MLNNIKPLYLHQFFMVLDFKVNKDWVVGMTTFSFYIFLYPLNRLFFLSLQRSKEMFYG